MSDRAFRALVAVLLSLAVLVGGGIGAYVAGAFSGGLEEQQDEINDSTNFWKCNLHYGDESEC